MADEARRILLVKVCGIRRQSARIRIVERHALAERASGRGRQVSSGRDAQGSVVDRDRGAVRIEAAVLVDDGRIHRYPRGLQVLRGDGEGGIGHAVVVARRTALRPDQVAAVVNLVGVVESGVRILGRRIVGIVQGDIRRAPHGRGRASRDLGGGRPRSARRRSVSPHWHTRHGYSPRGRPEFGYPRY